VLRHVTYELHLEHPRYQNRAAALSPQKDLIERHPEFFWAVRKCQWDSSRRRIDRKGNPHFHIIPNPHREK
jgi:hypothetical protein